ncbi:MAG: hypothetical protein DI539_12110 [Flavobacterium psychrophilum]|nr:MAG: hypothetical protein DI539_12110 [Flavobacterium psychrophilum]
MEDLLKEEEFLKQKDSYNPWKGFVLFYVVFTFSHIIITYLGKDMAGTDSSIFTILFGVFMILMPFVMIFSRQKNIRLPITTILTSVLILTSLYFCLAVIDPLITGNSYKFITDVPFIVYVQLYAISFTFGLICSGIILLIRWIKLKKLKPQSSFL